MERDTTEQLKDLVITISYVEFYGDDKPYAATRVYRYDLKGSIDEFIKSLEFHPNLVEGGRMRNERGGE
jgi:hypothetical protein